MNLRKRCSAASCPGSKAMTTPAPSPSSTRATVPVMARGLSLPASATFSSWVWPTSKPLEERSHSSPALT